MHGKCFPVSSVVFVVMLIECVCLILNLFVVLEHALDEFLVWDPSGLTESEGMFAQTVVCTVISNSLHCILVMGNRRSCST